MPAAAPSPARTRHRRSATLRALDTAGRLGSVVTLAALLVVAGAVGGAFDGVPVPTDVSSSSAPGGR